MQIVTGRKMNKKILTALVMMIFVVFPGFSTGNVSLSAVLDRDEIWLGDTVRLILTLNGSEEAIEPSLEIPGVSVTPRGGTTRSSSSVTSINGNVTKTVKKAYVYEFELKPKTTGTVEIPSISLNVEGQQVSTRELTLRVQSPEESDDFRLHLSFDRKKVYINEQCILTVSFQYEKSLKTLELSIPELDGYSFKSQPVSTRGDKYQININGQTVFFSQNDRGNVASLSTEIILRPDKAGKIDIDNSSAAFDAQSGYRQVQDFFGRIQNQEVYSRKVIPGNSASIEVLPFPESGKPLDFFGLSGRVLVRAEADPSEIHIGDPITFTLNFSGLNNTDIKIPSLRQYLGSGIDIPDTRSSANVSGLNKTITQTIRVNDKGVSAIPAMRFPYFDSESGEYRYAETEEIPLHVLDTKIITAEAVENPGADNGSAEKIRLEKKNEGIYFNYSGMELLETQQLSSEFIKTSIAIKIILFLPPIVFIIILIFTVFVPQIRENAAARSSRKTALKRLKRTAIKTGQGNVKESVKAFVRQLDSFMTSYGNDAEQKKINPDLEILSAVIYGGASISPEEAGLTADRIVRALSMRSGRDE